MADEQENKNMVIIETPLIIVFREGDRMICNLHPQEGMDHRHYAMILSDIIRHVARCYDLSKNELFELVTQEFDNPTSEIRGMQ